MLEELEAGTASESLTLKLDDEWLSVFDFEAHVEVVSHHLLREVHHHKVHLCARCELAHAWLNLEDVLG